MRKFLLAALSAVVSVSAAADMVFEKRDMKDGAWCAKGLESGEYYLQLEVEQMHVSLRHSGKVVDFNRAGPWLERGGRTTAVKESGPVKIMEGDFFVLEPRNDFARLTIAGKPLDYAPQKIFTRDLFAGPEYYKIDGIYADGVFTASVKSRTNAGAKGMVSVRIRDYWQRELASVENADADLSAPFKLSVKFADTKSGQLWAHVAVVDTEGRKSERIFPKVVDYANAFRETVPFNEGWERCGKPDDGTSASRTMRFEPPADAKWTKVEMPSLIKYPVTWFRTKRAIPVSFAGKRIFFRTFRLLGKADLYIDGNLAASFGKDFDFCGEREADITAFAKPGVEQQFAIVAQFSSFAVLPPEELAKNDPDFGSALAFDCSGGDRSAFSEIYLDARPAVSLGRVFVTTSYRNRKIEVKTDVPAGFKARHSVRRKGKKLLEWTSDAPKSECAWEKPVLWGPFEFPLLQLTTELMDANGAVVDAKDTRFGFREFWADGRRLMWNGHPVKGDARAFLSTWGWDFDRRIKRQSNADILLSVRNRGTRFVRHIYNADEMLDILDELGLPAANGGETIAGPSAEKSANREWWRVKEMNDKSMIESRFNHPSVMCWYLTNEYRAFSDDIHNPPVASAVRHAAALDPTRFAEAGCDLDLQGDMKIVSTHYPVDVYALRNGDAYMPDCFYWRPLDAVFTDGCKVPFGQVKNVANVAEKSAITWGRKPIFVNETGWDWFFAPPYGYTRLCGDDVFNDPTFLEKWHVATSVEYIRGHRDADVAMWTPWRWYTVDLASFVSPEIDVVAIQRYSRFYEGESVSFDVNCFYDKWVPGEAVWFWRIVDRRGKTAVAGEKRTHAVDTSALLRKKISFTAPESGVYTLEFGLEGLCEKARRLVVYPRTGAKAMYDNVIAADVPLSTNLLARAEAGETIVVLAREDYPEWLPEVPGRGKVSAAILRSFRPEHPVLKGVSKTDLQYFYPESIASHHSFSKPAGGNAQTIIEHGGPAGLVYSSLVEVPYGKGCFLYSRLVLEPEKNPVAAKLLANMSAYRRKTAPGKALYLAGADDRLENALRVRCGVALVRGEAKDIDSHPAAIVDGTRRLTKKEQAVLAKSGKPVLVFGKGNLAVRPVTAKAVKGRAVAKGRDPLFAGLTNQDLMWRGKYAEPDTAVADLGNEEFETEEGAIMYPAYFVRRGNFVFTTADPDVHHPAINSQVRRFWSVLAGNMGVGTGSFERPKKPKNLFYDPVDLSPFLDRTLEDAKDDDGEGSWNDQGMAQYLPMKFRHATGWVGMVPYRVARKGPCAFALASGHRKGGYPKVAVKIGRKADTVNWLFSSVWTAKGKLHYTVRIDYADGTSHTVDGKGGVNTFDCFEPNPDFSDETDTITSSMGFPTSNKTFPVANVYSTTFVNPHPEKTIDTLTFASGEKSCGRVGVFALTLGSKDPGTGALADAGRKALHGKLVAAAMAAVKAGETEKAIVLYEKALRADPSALGVYRSLGAIYEAEGNWHDALVTYRRSLEADYNQPDLWTSEKSMLEKLGSAK